MLNLKHHQWLSFFLLIFKIMLKLILIIFTFLFTTISVGQKKENELFEASKGKWEVPIEYYSKTNSKSFFEPTLYKYFSFITDSAYIVKSVFKGKVVLIREIDSLSLIVVVKFGSYYTIYNQLQNVFVSLDDFINTNQIIGQVGKNIDNEYELVLMLRKNDKEINPNDWINWKTKSKKNSRKY
jgi:hypothetical protein